MKIEFQYFDLFGAGHGREPGTLSCRYYPAADGAPSTQDIAAAIRTRLTGDGASR